MRAIREMRVSWLILVLYVCLWERGLKRILCPSIQVRIIQARNLPRYQRRQELLCAGSGSRHDSGSIDSLFPAEHEETSLGRVLELVTLVLREDTAVRFHRLPLGGWR
ncbi:Cystinosin [Manis pentadactyla]|nr:Cystinosin [Manis pentadactyla]